jgi:hypothetical protein
MLTAKVYPTDRQGERTDLKGTSAISAEVSERFLQMARKVLRFLPAKAYPEPEKGGRGKKSLVTKEFSTGYLSQARLVLRVLPDDAALVLSGALWLRRLVDPREPC